ncbi:MmyB family transcriptional regulator [Micromonosporaceae bacterium Da 78-11]
MVISDLSVVLAQNRASVLLAGDLSTGFTGDRRYLVYRWFTDAQAVAVHTPEERDRHARQLVADLRAAAGRRAGEATVTRLVERLQAASADFRRLWAEHEVAVRRADRKTFVHPRVGNLVMDCKTLVTPDLGQRLLVLTPADPATRERLALLLVLGVEEFPTGRSQPVSGADR